MFFGTSSRIFERVALMGKLKKKEGCGEAPLLGGRGNAALSVRALHRPNINCYFILFSTDARAHGKDGHSQRSTTLTTPLPSLVFLSRRDNPGSSLATGS